MGPGLTRITRIALRGAVLAACVFTVVSVRVVLSAREELAEAETLLAQHDHAAAIVHFRRAARWYAPLSPYNLRALGRLGELARSAEHNGDREGALAAYRAVRGSILATRSLYVPQRSRLDAANQRIASLMADEPAPGVDAGKSHEQLRREHLALLTPIPGPDVFWSCVLLLGFGCWVGAAFALSFRAIDDEDRWVPRELLRCGSFVVLGFGLFVLGLVLA
jgi:hypothetical protein